MQAIINARVFSGSEFTSQTVFIENGRIAGISDEKPSHGCEIINANGDYLVPGFIDLQIYGSGGNLFSAYPTPETLAQMDADLQGKGTTSFLACVATNTSEAVQASIAAAKAYRPAAKGFIGLHLEGPYLNPLRRGAHIGSLIRKAALDEVKHLLEEADGVIKMMTIAPELQDDNVINYLLDNKIVLSLGHSDASFAQATRAYNKGIITTTHLFNAMSPIHHRKPGIPIAAFQHKTAMASIIADGHHVDFEMVKFAHQQMQERLYFITDAVTSCSSGPYQHRLQGDKFITEDGTLSGSNITMLNAVQNAVEYCAIGLPEALCMAAAYPAKLMGWKTGRIEPGYDADLLLLSKDLELLQVINNPGRI